MESTEADARTKWCAHVRGARIESLEILGPDFTGRFQIIGGCNTDLLGRTRVPASCRCIASDCMQWRWASFGEADEHARKGYCGIAGKPVAP